MTDENTQALADLSEGLKEQNLVVVASKEDDDGKLLVKVVADASPIHRFPTKENLETMEWAPATDYKVTKPKKEKADKGTADKK